MSTSVPCRKEKREINLAHDILAIRRVLDSLPKQILTCPKCSEEVEIDSYLSNPGSGVPVGGALIGCEDVVPRVVNEIILRGIQYSPECGYWFKPEK